MRIGRKNKAVLIATLIAVLSAFGAGTYGISKHSSLESDKKDTYLLNSEVLQIESKQIEESITVMEESLRIEREKAFQEAEKQKMLAAALEQENKEKKIISRGGSGLNTVKAKSKPSTTQAKPSVKRPTASSAQKNVQATDEKELFYRLVSAEASGESFEGQLAVATVIMNRVKSADYANTITGVIVDKSWGYQFTPVLDGRINEPAVASAKKAVDMVLGGYRSFGPEVLFFLNPKKSVSPWITNNRTYYKTIGNHEYYR